jgi:predicted SnoaL-like aldol condensation-catalyzing enzyme
MAQSSRALFAGPGVRAPACARAAAQSLDGHGGELGLDARPIHSRENAMTNQSRKEAAIDFLTLAASGRVRDAYRRHVGPGFRHHNPCFRGDAASLMEAMEQNAMQNPDKVLEVQCALQDGDRVAVFSRVRQKPGDAGGAVVHIFRFDADRIVELWDIGQAVPEKSINENGMF